MGVARFVEELGIEAQHLDRSSRVSVREEVVTETIELPIAEGVLVARARRELAILGGGGLEALVDVVRAKTYATERRGTVASCPRTISITPSRIPVIGVRS